MFYNWFVTVLFLLFLTNNSFSNSSFFTIIVPSYNNALWYQKNLESIFSQTYKNYRVIYIDDCSQDNTALLVENYIHEKKQVDKVTLIKNNERRFKLANMYTAIHLCTDSEIIVELDGDDWFSSERVLEKLACVYQDPGVWLTYGNHVQQPSYSPVICKQVPEIIIKTNSFRDYYWVTSALRTYKAGLFKRIKLIDLLDLEAGYFFPVAADLAYMFPMLEMAGHHSRFIPDILYIYNLTTPTNDFKTRFQQQQNTAQFIRNKERYLPLKEQLIERADKDIKDNYSVINTSTVAISKAIIDQCVQELERTQATALYIMPANHSISSSLIILNNFIKAALITLSERECLEHKKLAAIYRIKDLQEYENLKNLVAQNPLLYYRTKQLVLLCTA